MVRPSTGRWLWLAVALAAGPVGAQTAPAPQAETPRMVSPTVSPTRALAATCANCHGTDGRVQGDAVRALAGMPAAALEQAMKDYKSGARTGTIMHQIAKGYTDDQIRVLALYFSAQRP